MPGFTVRIEKGLVLQLVFFFLLTQVLGLAVASDFISEGVQTTIVNEDPDDPVNAIGLIAYIVVFTGLLLLVIMVLRWAWVLRVIEALAVLLTSLLVFDVFFPAGAAFLYAVLLVSLRIAMRESILLKNFTSVVAVSAVGALLGVSLGVFPVMLGMTLLAVYDLLAVFVTKHMITMAKAITAENLAFTLTMPTKKHVYQLGTGDLVIPLMFAASVFKNLGDAIGIEGALLPVGILLFASLVGLIGTLEYCERSRRALPALPLQVFLMLLVWGGYMVWSGAFVL